MLRLFLRVALVKEEYLLWDFEEIFEDRAILLLSLAVRLWECLWILLEFSLQILCIECGFWYILGLNKKGNILFWQGLKDSLLSQIVFLLSLIIYNSLFLYLYFYSSNKIKTKSHSHQGAICELFFRIFSDFFFCSFSVSPSLIVFKVGSAKGFLKSSVLIFKPFSFFFFLSNN